MTGHLLVAPILLPLMVGAIMLLLGPRRRAWEAGLAIGVLHARRGRLDVAAGPSVEVNTVSARGLGVDAAMTARRWCLDAGVRAAIEVAIGGPLRLRAHGGLTAPVWRDSFVVREPSGALTSVYRRPPARAEVGLAAVVHLGARP